MVRAGHVYKYVSDTANDLQDLQVGMVMEPPSESAKSVKVELMWSSEGNGAESGLLDAARLRIASNDEQITAVESWCVQGGVYKSLAEPNFARGRIGVAVRNLNEHAEIKLCWLDTGTARRFTRARAATLQFATAEEHMGAIHGWCRAGNVYACRNSGKIGISIGNPEIVSDSVQVRMFWLETAQAESRAVGTTVQLRGLKEYINGYAMASTQNGLLASVVEHSDKTGTIVNLHVQPGIGLFELHACRGSKQQTHIHVVG